jgi:hypothetical protein
MNISNLTAIAVVNAMTALFNVGGAGSIVFYDGTQPAGADVAITTQNVLGTLTLNATAFAAAVDNTGSARATHNTVATANATAAGTATWARVFDGAGTAIEDGSVGVVASGADFEAADVTYEVNDEITLVTWFIQIAETGV